MSEYKKLLIDLIPDSVDNAVKNITDKPTQNMGTTLADIWYLVFGDISQAAEKRKLKYSYALQEFEKELKEKISKIPEDKLVEPDIQVIAQALEASKYCIEKEELRHMFASLIASSMNQDNYIPPILVNIIRYLSPIDSKILNYMYTLNHKKLKYEDLINSLHIDDPEILYIALIELEQMQLIYNNSEPLKGTFSYTNIKNVHVSLKYTSLTPLGELLCSLCI